MNASLQLRVAPLSSCRMAGIQRILGVGSLALALAVLEGCGQDAAPATVEGTLRLHGRPLDNCLITFFPESAQDPKLPRSTGLTDRQGFYRLRFDNQQAGTAIGWQRVTVQDLSVSTGVHRRDHGTVDVAMEKTAPPPPVRRSRVTQRFMSPEDTPLRQEVKPGHQVIDFDI